MERGVMVDPTTRAAWLVHGETELGPQRRCRDCRIFMPLDEEFWYRREWENKDGRTSVLYEQPCKGCQQPAHQSAAQRSRLRRKWGTKLVGIRVAPRERTPYGDGVEPVAIGGRS